MVELFESVPNFSEGRREDVIAGLIDAGRRAHFLDGDADPDHNRYVLTLAGSRQKLAEALLACVAAAVETIDLRRHVGVHPRVGAADVVPIIPLGDVTLEAARDLAHEIGHRVWDELKVPVFFYGEGEGRRLADIRAGRAKPDLGGPGLHPTAGAVSVGARPFLVAFNVIVYGYDLVAARALARSLRESADGLRGVQALAFPLSGDRVQLSMNVFRLDETTPSDVMAELERRGVSTGAQQVVGLSPAFAANEAASGRVLEGRLAAVAAGVGARRSQQRADEEYRGLAKRLMGAAGALLGMEVDQDAILAGAEQAAALVAVLRAARVLDGETETLLRVAARGLRRAVSPATEAIYRTRVEALDARLV
jgi:glutamate formiminotransferase / 5-formyltetrahydrofolate cyclo-ligase